MDEKIRSYIEKMKCNPKDGYESVGKWALAENLGIPFNTHEEQSTYEKSLNRVIRKLKKEGLKIGRYKDWIHRNG